MGHLKKVGVQADASVSLVSFFEESLEPAGGAVGKGRVVGRWLLGHSPKRHQDHRSIFVVVGLHDSIQFAFHRPERPR